MIGTFSTTRKSHSIQSTPWDRCSSSSITRVEQEEHQPWAPTMGAPQYSPSENIHPSLVLPLPSHRNSQCILGRDLVVWWSTDPFLLSHLGVFPTADAVLCPVAYLGMEEWTEPQGNFQGACTIGLLFWTLSLSTTAAWYLCTGKALLATIAVAAVVAFVFPDQIAWEDKTSLALQSTSLPLK